MKTTWKQERSFLEGDSGLSPEERGNIEASNQDILKRYPPWAVIPHIRVKVKARSGFPVWLRYVASAAAALLIVPFFMLQNNDGLRIKGGVDTLLLYRETATTPDLLTDGSEAFTGDRIQAVWRTEPGRWGLLLSVDGRGTWTYHTEAALKWTTAMRNGAQAFPWSITLDDAPDFETFYLVTANEDLDYDSVRRALANSNLPEGWSVTKVTLKKGIFP